MREMTVRDAVKLSEDHYPPLNGSDRVGHILIVNGRQLLVVHSSFYSDGWVVLTPYGIPSTKGGGWGGMTYLGYSEKNKSFCFVDDRVPNSPFDLSRLGIYIAHDSGWLDAKGGLHIKTKEGYEIEYVAWIGEGRGFDVGVRDKVGVQWRWVGDHFDGVAGRYINDGGVPSGLIGYDKNGNAILLGPNGSFLKYRPDSGAVACADCQKLFDGKRISSVTKDGAIIAVVIDAATGELMRPDGKGSYQHGLPSAFSLAESISDEAGRAVLRGPDGSLWVVDRATNNLVRPKFLVRAGNAIAPNEHGQLEVDENGNPIIFTGSTEKTFAFRIDTYGNKWLVTVDANGNVADAATTHAQMSLTVNGRQIQVRATAARQKGTDAQLFEVLDGDGKPTDHMVTFDGKMVVAADVIAPAKRGTLVEQKNAPGTFEKPAALLKMTAVRL